METEKAEDVKTERTGKEGREVGGGKERMRNGGRVRAEENKMSFQTNERHGRSLTLVVLT